MSNRVNVHSKLTVISGRPTGPGKTHKFTPLDQAMGQYSLHMILYYRVNPFEEGPFDEYIDNLRVSLSELLDTYPVVMGRLTRGGDGEWELKCNDAGVRIYLAHVGTTLDEWLGSVDDGSKEKDLTVWDDMPDDPTIWPPFRIQLSDFEGGGLAIGLSFTHMYADLTSAAMFFKTWAEISRGEPVTHSPFFDLPNFPNANKETAKDPQINPENPPKMAMSTATFQFSNATIKQHLSKLNIDATPFDFLAALFWTRLAQFNSPRDKQSLSIGIDFRKVLMDQPNIPNGYFFGNAMNFSILSLDSTELEGGGVGQVAELVHRHVANLDENELLENVPVQMYGPELTCVNMEHMVMYEAMFKKDEKPVLVSCHVGNVEGEGLIMVMPSSEGGLARTVTVTLPQEQIRKLCEDQIIMDMQPTMVIDGK